MNKRFFDSSLSWSHVFTVIGFLGAMFAQWMHMETRMTGVEATVTALRSAQVANEARMRESEARARESDAEIRVGIRNLDGKVTAMMLQGYRPTQMVPSPVAPPLAPPPPF